MWKGSIRTFSTLSTLLLTAALTKGMQLSTLSIVHDPADLMFLNTMASSLTCEARGYPEPTVTWFADSGGVVESIKGLREVSSDGTLRFEAFSPENYDRTIHNSKYRCKASSRLGSVFSRWVQVNAVLDKLYSPMVHHQTAIVGSSALFRCFIPDDMKDFISVLAWHIRSQKRDSDQMIVTGMSADKFHALSTGELLIEEVAASHNGYEVSCSSRNVLNNVTLTSSRARLFVNAPEEHNLVAILEPTSQTVITGRTVYLHCQASGYPFPSYTWHKENQVLALEGRISVVTGGSIRIRSASPSDSGIYKCVMQQGSKEMHRTVKLRVIVPLEITKPPEFQLVRTGEMASFSCEATGTAPILHEWRKDGEPLEKSNRYFITDRALNIFGVEKEDEAIYQCLAKNDVEEIQVSTRLVVDGSPPVIKVAPKAGTIRAGESVTISCKATGQPIPTMYWRCDGEELAANTSWSSIQTRVGSDSVESQLIVSNAQPQHSGKYTCMVENYVGIEDAGTMLFVTGKPTIIDFKEKLSFSTGKTLQVNCVAKGYPAVSFQWHKDGAKVLPMDRFSISSNGTLFVKNFQASDAGKYLCSAKNVHGLAQRVAEVTVLDAPQIIPFTLPPVAIGERAHYICGCSRGSNDGLTITWYKNGIDVTNMEGLEIRELTFGKIISFSNVKPEHRGRYTCVVNNKAGTASYSADLIVYEKPSFAVKPSDTSVLASQPFNLACQATGFPEPQITWYKLTNDGELDIVSLDYRVAQLNNGTLINFGARVVDDGKYLCKATSSVSEPISHVAVVTVKVPATVISYSNPEPRQRIGLPVTVTCSAVGTSSLDLKWFRRGVIISEDDRQKYVIVKSTDTLGTPSVFNSSLTVNEVMRSDSGMYECLATNPFGTSNQEFQLYVEEKPDVPYAVESTQASARSLTVKWLPAFDGNSPITHYKLSMKEAQQQWTQARYFIIPGNVTTHQVQDLRPGFSYVFVVSAANRHGSSDPSVETVVETNEEAPAAAPQNVTVKVTSAYEMIVTWQPPTAMQRNGVILGYHVAYQPVYDLVEGQTFNETIMTGSGGGFTVRNLRPFTRYKLQVQAFTKAGVGPPSSSVFAKTWEAAPSSPPESVEVVPLTSQSMVVTWKQPASQTLNGILQGYKVRYEDVAAKQEYMKIVINGEQATLASLKKFAMYRISVLAYTNVGDGVSSSSVEKRTLEDLPGPPSSFSASPATPTQVMVTWQAPIEPNGIIRGYILYYKSQETGSQQIEFSLAETERSHMLQGLDVGRRYDIWLKAKTLTGVGASTPVISTTTQNQVPAAIVPDRPLTVTAVIDSEVVLPCLAVGHPKPIITWVGPLTSESRHAKLWMVDGALRLQKVQSSDAGVYNCTASNTYGSSSNTVNLVVQVPPAPPKNVFVKLAAHRVVNITWSPGFDGYNPIAWFHLDLLVDDDVSNFWQPIKLNVDQQSYTVDNVSAFVYFRIRAENKVGVGLFGDTYMAKLKSSGIDLTVVRKGGQLNPTRRNVRHIMLPVIIAFVIIAAILLFVLLIASWDRDAKRMKKPACYRLWSCGCRKKQKGYYNEGPYGEVGMPWPWNIASNRHSGAFDVEISSDTCPREKDPLQQCAQVRPVSYNVIYHSDRGSESSDELTYTPFCPKYTPADNKKGKSAYTTSNSTTTPATKGYESVPHKISVSSCSSARLPPQSNGVNLPSVGRKATEDLTIMERYLQSQQELKSQNLYDPHPCRSVTYEPPVPSEKEPLSPDSDIFIPKKIIDHPSRSPRGSGDGKSADMSEAIETSGKGNANAWLSDHAPRVLLRNGGTGRRASKKSLESFVLRTLENIDEAKLLSRSADHDDEHLSKETAMLIQEMLERRGARSYDSISSTCSSSVGELKRAYEFGKKYGLQEYEIPAYLVDNSVENDDFDEDALKSINEHLANLEVANFSAKPRDSNDIKVQIPIPVRVTGTLRQSGSEGDLDDLQRDGEFAELSLV